MKKDPATNEVEVFLPSPGVYDSAVAEHEDFLNGAAELAQQGHRITVYVRGEDDWAFTQCEPVAEILEINGDSALPITLLGAEIMGMYAYPSTEKLARLTSTPISTPKQATNACAPTSAPAPRSSAAASLWRVDPPEPKGPDIGDRWNLMGGDTGQGVPPRSE